MTLALRQLHRWARLNATRDVVIINAWESGISINEISRITGLARTTVQRIIRK